MQVTALAVISLVAPRLCRGDDFFRDSVAPVLRRRCLSCHNAESRKGDFSLQTAESAFAEGYITPGDAASSLLLEVITPVDGQATMPKDADPLSESDRQAIRRWIESGAEWPSDIELSVPQVADLNWWSLRSLESPDVPPADDAWCRTPIDAFVLARLKERNLTPSVEADRTTLIRRLYFDLIGLPPTPERVEEFVKDDDVLAYDKLVDELLDSEHYGERWARHWLDVVHYADTHGYDKDKPRPNAWPYRDYVIRSFNEDKPYARFVLEQIAGDILWPHTRDGITAVGFIAAGPWDFIGHAEVPETKIDGRIARHLDRDDMVSSTMNTFTSTTVQCARCHNHKFDPVTQEHYYSLQAIFAALDRADRNYDDDVITSRRRALLAARQHELQSEKELLDATVREAAGEELEKLESSLAQLEEQKRGSKERPEFGYHSQVESTASHQKWFQVDLGQSIPIDQVVYVGAHDQTNNIGHGFGFPPRFKIEVADDVDFRAGVTVLVDQTREDVENPGTKPQIVSVKTETRARYVRMTATKLAARNNDYIFALGELSVLSKGKNAALHKDVSALDSIEAPVRWQRSNVVDGYHFGQAVPPELLAEIEATQEHKQALLERATTASVRRKLTANVEATEQIDQALADLPKPAKVYAGTIHTGRGAFKGTGASGGQPRSIHVLHRGNILEPLEPVSAGTIPVITGANWRFSLDAGHSEGDRRVALAHWLVRNDNPLTWRSIVNRVWQYHFGRGIVDSPNDFGRMGREPSHPNLLDWLAAQFRDGDQSLKALHKLIVTSAVYRQSAADDAANSLIDGSNVYLWRMNRRRLEAEELRDAVLAVSGKLDRTMYGPGMRLFVLERPEHSPHYEYHKHDPDDPNSHRRAVYRFIVRSQPDPFMTTLDCADSSQSVAKRDETVTALQALSLLNNKFMVRMAEHFAMRVRQEAGNDSEQAQRAFALATGHMPTLQEREDLTSFTSKYGLENTCRLLFNLNEFVFVD